MRIKYYSHFWLTGGVLTAPEWHQRDAGVLADPSEVLSMPEWLQLAEAERGDIVERYAFSRPKARAYTSR